MPTYVTEVLGRLCSLHSTVLHIYYVLTDFGGNGPSTILETVDGNYARVEKNSGAETWAGGTGGTVFVVATQAAEDRGWTV